MLKLTNFHTWSMWNLSRINYASRKLLRQDRLKGSLAISKERGTHGSGSRDGKEIQR